MEIVRDDIALFLDDTYCSNSLANRGPAELFEEEIRRLNNRCKVGEKSIGDFFWDEYRAVDIKSKCITKEYSVPNLVSAKKAFDFLSDPRNELLFLFVDYEAQPDLIQVVDARLIYLEEIADWTIRSQGNGVIQMNKVLFRERPSRDEWLLEFKSKMATFIEKERAKWNHAIGYYELSEQEGATTYLL